MHIKTTLPKYDYRQGSDERHALDLAQDDLLIAEGIVRAFSFFSQL
jgi:uridine kinase